MAVNQADILLSLEENTTKLSSYIDKKEFFYDFLHAYGLPKSTITLLRKGDVKRACGIHGDIGLTRKIYFKDTMVGEDLDAVLDGMIESDVVRKNKLRFILVTDFVDVVAYDVDAKEFLRTSIELLPKQYAFFLPLAGYEKAIMFSEHPADIRASEKMGRLFDLIKQRNALTTPEEVHALNVFLTRLLFCFYAEDTGLFAENQFTNAISSYTQKDGCDMAAFFTRLFYVLNQADGSNAREVLPAHYTDFPYVNGGLFAAESPVPEFSANARKLLIDCGTLDWSEINPDIFGSMFQAVIDTEQRGNLGQHYTSVPNIMRVIQPLFLDDLEDALLKAVDNATKLQALLMRLTRIRAMDVACGSGNFLIIAYKELRLFEMRVIDALNELQPQMYFSGITLDQFFGIEIDDFAAEIAVLSLWIAEHQMSNLFKEKFGNAPAPLPLGKAGNILCANSLRVDWREVMPKEDSRGNPYEVYLFGNPPFLGDGSRSLEQQHDMDIVLSPIKNKRQLDYIATFFWKGAQYIQDGGDLSFVSTSSICQGIQVSILWQPIFDLGVHISFAYQSFPWSNNAKSRAAVHVVIIGLSTVQNPKTLFKMEGEQVQKSIVNNISPYLTNGSNLSVSSRAKPITPSNLMFSGNKAADFGFYSLTYDEKELLVQSNPAIKKWIRRYMGAAEFLKNTPRYCIWLVGATDSDIAAIPEIQVLADKVRLTRLASKSLTTQSFAKNPYLFSHICNQGVGDYLLMPIVTSQRREYVPIGFVNASVITSNKVNIVPNATFYDFGVLTSRMHNTWISAISGRMKSDYSYSNTVVYNTFPWAETTQPQRDRIEELAKEVLLVREDYVGKSLAELYDPDKMPDTLRAAHKALDLAVDRLYRDAPFRDNTERLEHLFARYEKLTAKVDSVK